MKVWRRVLISLGIIGILVVICSTFLVKMYLVPETVRTHIIPALEEIIRQEISYSEIKVGSGGTITLKDFIVHPASAPQSVLLECKGAVLHCRILPLLTQKKIVIEEITLNQPYITVIREAQGRVRFTHDFPTRMVSPATNEPPRDGSPNPKLSLTITQLNVKKGMLSFEDFNVSSTPFQLVLKDINAHAYHLSPVSSFPLELSAEIPSAPPAFLKLSAQLNPLHKEVESKVELTPLDILPFLPYFSTLPFALAKGCVSLDLSFRLQRSLDFSSRGTIALRELAFSAPGTIFDALNTINLNAEHQLTYTHAEDRLVIEKLDTTLQGIMCSLEGTVTQCRTNPSLHLTFNTGRLPVRDIITSFPAGFLPEWSTTITSGSLESNLSIKGGMWEPREWVTDGFLNLEKIVISPFQMSGCETKIDGRITFRDRQMNIEELTSSFLNSSLSLSGTIDNYLKGPLKGEIRLRSPSLVLDDFVACQVQNRQVSGHERNKEKLDDENGIWPFIFNNVALKGVLFIEDLRYRNVHLTGLHADCTLNNNTFTLAPLTAQCGDGTLNLKNQINLGVRGLEYSLQLDVHSLPLTPWMNALAPTLKERFEGTVDLSCELKGSGLTHESLKNHLQGKGTISIAQMKVSNFSPLKTISSFLKADTLDTLNFDQSRGTFQVRDGLIHLESSLTGKELELFPRGTVGLDAYLDLVLDIKTSPELSEKIANEALTKYFHDDRGWTEIALAIKGPRGSITVTPAPSTIKKISEMIIDIMLKKEEVDGAIREDKKKALEELLKDVGGKSSTKKSAQ